MVELRDNHPRALESEKLEVMGEKMIEETDEEEMEEDEDDEVEEEEDHTHRDGIFRKRIFTAIR